MIQWKHKRAWKIIVIIVSIFLLSISLGAYKNRPAGSGKNKLQMEDIPGPAANERILVFSPHPDDETVAAGGYLYMADQAGAVVHIVLVTDGNKRGLEKKRYREFHKATAILGIEKKQLEIWGYHDGALKKADKSLNRQVRKAILEFQPDVILYPHPLDHHSDHAKLGSVMERELCSLSQTGLKYRSYRYLVHYWLYPRPLFDKNKKLVQPGSILGADQKWQQIHLSKKDKAVKQQALEEYQTQLQNPFLKALLAEFIRDNELFAQYNAK